jgi:MtaA/CmuA family methyltransferase
LDSRLRVEGFLRRSPIDRVPVQLQNMAVTVGALGRDFPEVYRDGKLVAAGHIHEWEKHRHDGVIVDIGTQAAAESLGCAADYPPGDIPRVTRPALESWADLDRLAIPDPWRTFPLTVVLDAVGILKSTIGKHTTIIATVDQGPFTLASQLIGMDRFPMEIGLREHEAELRRLLAFCTDFTLAYGTALHAAGADIVRMGDSTSGPDMVSPKTYAQYAFPYHERLAEEFARRGIVFEFHICGNATPIIRKMVATGAAYVEIDEKPDLEAAREAVRERGGIGGPISPSLLRFGTESEVEAACRRVLEAWLPQGGLFFGAGCTLPGDTPEANIRTLMMCAEQFGSYP